MKFGASEKNTSVNFQEELATFNVFKKAYTPLTTNWEKSLFKFVLTNSLIYSHNIVTEV